jgi:hypothetical protein
LNAVHEVPSWRTSNVDAAKYLVVIGAFRLVVRGSAVVRPEPLERSTAERGGIEHGGQLVGQPLLLLLEERTRNAHGFIDARRLHGECQQREEGQPLHGIGDANGAPGLERGLGEVASLLEPLLSQRCPRTIREQGPGVLFELRLRASYLALRGELLHPVDLVFSSGDDDQVREAPRLEGDRARPRRPGENGSALDVGRVDLPGEDEREEHDEVQRGTLGFGEVGPEVEGFLRETYRLRAHEVPLAAYAKHHHELEEPRPLEPTSALQQRVTARFDERLHLARTIEPVMHPQAIEAQLDEFLPPLFVSFGRPLSESHRRAPVGLQGVVVGVVGLPCFSRFSMQARALNAAPEPAEARRVAFARAFLLALGAQDVAQTFVDRSKPAQLAARASRRRALRQGGSIAGDGVIVGKHGRRVLRSAAVVGGRAVVESRLGEVMTE